MTSHQIISPPLTTTNDFISLHTHEKSNEIIRDMPDISFVSHTVGPPMFQSRNIPKLIGDSDKIFIRNAMKPVLQCECVRQLFYPSLKDRNLTGIARTEEVCENHFVSINIS